MPLMRASLPLLIALCAAPAQGAGLHRFALVAGNDEGGSKSRPLFFAREDARKVYDILRRLGGVEQEDSALLLNASAEAFLAALGELERKAKRASERGERTALLVFYSGHARDGALELGKSALPFAALKGRLAQAPADVRIGVFDACRSGELARAKGVRRVPAFDVEASAGRDARGLVILTSSAADEDSQESDQLGGSYFSHHLTSGLLGGADRSGDGRVSLSEAYAYAYERTVADTAESGAGAQHPTFSFDLAGNGDLTLTEVARSEGVLFPAVLGVGPYYVVSDSGLVVAEVQKEAGVERRLALMPGHYRVKRRLPDHLQIGEVTVVAGGVTALDPTSLRDVPFSDDPVKGVSRYGNPHVALALTGAYQSFFDAGTRSQLFPSSPLVGLEVALHDYIRKDWVVAFDAAYGWGSGAISVSGVPRPFRSYQLGFGASAWVEWPIRWVSPFVGLRVAWLLLGRSVEGTGPTQQIFSTVTPGLVAGLRLAPWAGWSFTARTRVHYLLYNIDQNRSLGYWELNAGVGRDF